RAYGGAGVVDDGGVVCELRDLQRSVIGRPVDLAVLRHAIGVGGEHGGDGNQSRTAAVICTAVLALIPIRGNLSLVGRPVRILNHHELAAEIVEFGARDG